MAPSERQKLLRELESAIEITAAMSDCPEADDVVLSLVDQHAIVSAARYLSRPEPGSYGRGEHWTTKCPAMFYMNDSDFRKEFRVTKTQFMTLLRRIDSDTVFVSTGRKPQAPVKYQLLVAMFRFTHDGNAASAFMVHQNFGIGEGTAVLWTNRVIIALVRIERDITYWPDSEERDEISKAFDYDYDVPGGCVGVIDGFHVVLFQKPSRQDGTDFYNRKGSYSFNILAICDQKKRIRHLTVGNVGRSGDNPIWTASMIYRHPEDHFTARQFVLADSGFQPSDHCVPLFPKLVGQAELPVNERQFNRRLARPRVLVEHTFGILKGRFSSLQSLRVRIHDSNAEKRVNLWVRACVVIHNVLQASGDDSGEEILQEGAQRGPSQTERVMYEEAPRGKQLAKRHHPRRVELMKAMGLGIPQGGLWINK